MSIKFGVQSTIEEHLSMEKKSILNSLKGTKKANVIAAGPAKKAGASTRKILVKYGRYGKIV